MHRRDFFRSRPLAQAAGQILGALDELTSMDDTSTEEVALLRLGWRAMATRFEILLPFGTADAMAAAQDAFALLDELEDQLTVYREHSEVCRLNRLGPSRMVPLEARLFSLLQLARQVHQDSGGAFDVTSGCLIKAWGFYRGPRRVPSPAELVSALARVGMQHVEFDASRLTIRYHVPGLEINLGSIGKGYALDRLGEILTSRWNSRAMLLHGGSSSVYAKGDPHGAERGWRVRIRHPWDAQRYLAEVWLRDRALGTSAATFQYLEYQGQKLGHVLDPRRGWPASGSSSVSVVAPTAALADALSTAFYVGGLELARSYCASHPDVGVILLPEGAESPIVIGLKPTDYNLLACST